MSSRPIDSVRGAARTAGHRPEIHRPAKSRGLADYRTNETIHCTTPAPSSLVTAAQDPGTLMRPCPRFAGRSIEGRPAYCARLNCPVCVRINAFKIARAIALAEPVDTYRLSLVGETWKEIQSRMTRTVSLLRKQLGVFEHVWHVEANPRGTGNHVHGWSWGGRLTNPLLSEVATRAGMGLEVHAGAWHARAAEDPMVTYGMKTALAESSDTAISPTTRQFLALNGGRLVHSSRAFYREGAGGARIPTRREAERRAGARVGRCRAGRVAA